MTNPLIGYVSAYHLLMYFFIYGFLGWTAEVAYAAYKRGKFVNRGFLNGPICPIYGVGMALLILFLNPVSHLWWLLFIAGTVFASLLELVTGAVLDKIFKTKWWDYSKEPLNIKGYICLKFSLLWGAAVLLLFNTIVPVVNAIIDFIPFEWWGLAVSCVLAVAFIADFITVIVQLKKLRANLKEVIFISSAIRKASDKIGENISEGTLAVISRARTLSHKLENSRLGKAFPMLNRHSQRTEDDCRQLEKRLEIAATNEKPNEKSDDKE